MEKTFKLNNDPPVNIMVNGSPTINNFPISLLINEFEKIDKSDDIEKITDEFLEYIGKTVPKTDIDNFIENKIDDFELLYDFINQNDYHRFIELTKTFDVEIPKFIGNKFNSKFNELIKYDIPKKQENELIEAIKKAFCQYLLTESTGIVITGISKEHFFPSIISLNIILNNNGKIEIMNKKSKINYNRTEIEIYGQSDVIDSYFTGIDEKLEDDIFRLVEIIMNPTKNQLTKFKSELKRLKIINKNRILKNIDSLSDKDLFELMEILIKITSIKIKLTTDITSSGGEIHIEKITKQNGIEEKENIYKIIETKEKIR